MSRRADLNMLGMIILCVSLFPLSRDASPPVDSMDVLNLPTSKLVKSIEFSKASSSSALTRFHGCCLFLNIVSMKHMMWTGDFLDAVCNTHIILLFSKTKVRMEVGPRMEVTL